MLITDYSSVMFDFAPTGRPMLFFTYDLEQYRDQLRGFYFDFEAAAPGPLLTTSDEVIAALADIDAVAAGYQAAYGRRSRPGSARSMTARHRHGPATGYSRTKLPAWQDRFELRTHPLVVSVAGSASVA